MLERSDEALSIVRYRARGRQSGLELDESVAHVFNFRDGKILQMRMFGNIDKARQRFLREVDKGGADER